MSVLLLLLLLKADKFKTGGVYYLPVESAEPLPAAGAEDAAAKAHRQQQQADVVKQLQKDLLTQLGWEGLYDKASTVEELRRQIDHLFATQLSQRCHLLILDGLWSQKMIQQFQFDHMQGALLATATVSFWTDASELSSTAQATAAWTDNELGVGEVRLQSDAKSKKVAEALLKTYVNPDEKEKKVSPLLLVNVSQTSALHETAAIPFETIAAT